MFVLRIVRWDPCDQLSPGDILNGAPSFASLLGNGNGAAASLINVGGLGSATSGGGGGLTRQRLEQMVQKRETQNSLSKEMKRAAFRVFSALAANDEDIRKKIIETDNLMEMLVASIQDTDNVKLQMAAVSCLHSLSRSVQLLRTTFQVWRKFKEKSDNDFSTISI